MSKKTSRIIHKNGKLDYKDIALLYGKSGFGAVKKLLDADKTSIDVARKAADHVEKLDDDSSLGDKLDEHYPTLEPGRAPPKLGEKRRYRAQQYDVKGTSVLRHIRLPVELITKKKGEEVEAHFVEGKIVVTRASA